MSEDSLSDFTDQSNEMADELSKTLFQAITQWRYEAIHNGVPSIIAANAAFRASTLVTSFVVASMSLESEGKLGEDLDREEFDEKAHQFFKDLVRSMDGLLEKHIKDAVVIRIDREKDRENEA